MKQITYALGSIFVGVWLNFKPGAFETKCDVVFMSDTLKNVVYEIQTDTINDKITIYFPEIER